MYKLMNAVYFNNIKRSPITVKSRITERYPTGGTTKRKGTNGKCEYVLRLVTTSKQGRSYFKRVYTGGVKVESTSKGKDDRKS